MEYFVEKNSIVRKIWGKSDTILLIFAGSAAEFALNKAVDWLYFTGNLPADPLRRLFSTVAYAREIIFASEKDALKAIDRITAIHVAVENARGSKIPAWAYRDVLFMLIHYSIASFEVLERKLAFSEKKEVFQVFFKVGSRMGIPDLPENFEKWLPMRSHHLINNLSLSAYSLHLYQQYKKHLGWLRYKILLEAQIIVAPSEVKKLLGLRIFSFLRFLLPFYKISRVLYIDKLIKKMILPATYQKEIKALDRT